MELHEFIKLGSTLVKPGCVDSPSCKAFSSQHFPIPLANSNVHDQHTVGPLIIESFWAEKRVSTGALGALDDPLVVKTKI